MSETIDLARLRELAERIQEGDRPLPWVVHSGCSYRRIASAPTRENPRSFPDGNVLHAYKQRSDGHPDLSMGEDQLNALVDIANSLPALIAALEEREKYLWQCQLLSVDRGRYRDALTKIADRAEKLRKGTDDWFELVEFEVCARTALGGPKE